MLSGSARHRYLNQGQNKSSTDITSGFSLELSIISRFSWSASFLFNFLIAVFWNLLLLWHTTFCHFLLCCLLWECCCGNRFVECLWGFQAPAGFGGRERKKSSVYVHACMCLRVCVNQCWLELPGWPNAHLCVLDCAWREKFYSCLYTGAESNLVSKHK